MKGKLLLIIIKRTVIAVHNVTCIIYILYTNMFYETGDTEHSLKADAIQEIKFNENYKISWFVR